MSIITKAELVMQLVNWPLLVIILVIKATVIMMANSKFVLVVIAAIKSY